MMDTRASVSWWILELACCSGLIFCENEIIKNPIEEGSLNCCSSGRRRRKGRT